MTQADLNDIPALALDWHRSGAGAVIATVVETWGSAPRRAGSQLVVNLAGHMMGSVSGGCVEGAVVLEAMEVLGEAGGAPRLLEFGVSDDDAFAVGLACGGRIRVLVERVGRDVSTEVLQGLVAARAAKTPVAYVTSVSQGGPRLDFAGAYGARFRADRSGLEEDGDTFVAIHNPPLRLIVVGGVHIAQLLLPMAAAAGYACALIEPRPAFGSPERFEGVEILDDWPDEAMAALAPDSRSAVVTLTHDPKLDDPAIVAALRSDCFYLGCLGSKRTHAKRVARLEGAGVVDLARIHAPVGLDIGAKNPAEIAISIMGQITELLRRGGDIEISLISN